MKPIESPTTEAAGEPVAWALKGRSGSIREVTDDKDATVNWHPDFIVPLYERPAAIAHELTDEQIRFTAEAHGYDGWDSDLIPFIRAILAEQSK